MADPYYASFRSTYIIPLLSNPPRYVWERAWVGRLLELLPSGVHVSADTVMPSSPWVPPPSVGATDAALAFNFI